VKPSNNILSELQEVAPALAKLDKVNLYEVQEGYFGQSQTNILASIDAPEVSVLSSIPHRELYPAPAASYFSSFSGDLMQRLHAEEVGEELSYALPILQQVEKKQSYALPAAYFSSFPARVTKLVSGEAHSSVRHWGTKWAELSQTILGLISMPRYAFAMASVVSVIVGIGLFMNTQNASLSGDEKVFAQMQQIPDAELTHYIAKHRDEFDERTILHNIDNVEFTHYFDKPEQVTPHIESHANGTADDELTSEDILD
jgi:hypothetical protein